jgi:HK97 family phage major capsid protein
MSTILATDALLDRGLPGALYRSYCEQMRAEFKSDYAPTFHESVRSMLVAATTFDSGHRGSLIGNLNRGHYHQSERHNFRTPQYLGLPDLLTPSRTMVESIGAKGGFTVAYSVRDQVVDKARTTQGPWSRCNIWEVETHEYLCPVVYETSQANGSRFGGFNSTVGMGEIVMPAASDGKLAQIRMVQDRILLYTTVSRDIWADSGSIARWLHYCGLAEFRAQLENIMINGSGPLGLGPRGVITSPSTVVVAKQSGQAALSIVAANIDALYGAIADGNTEQMVWHAGRDTIDAIDQLAVSGQYPEIQYAKAFSRDNPNPWPTLKGKPLLTSPFCPATGNPGDLIAVDWTDYALTWLRPKPTSGGLEVVIGVPKDDQHRGMVGLPEGAVEMRVSDEFLFASDELAIAFKMRMGGGFFWPGTSTLQDGHVVGPAAIVAQR